ncbi:MAG TPA: AAA-associated domain-containing protein, partial [Streptosporangiaceae bacterium]|nr:AAA-associated domain-containing protein [Streptosporangiaceae bacterium]
MITNSATPATPAGGAVPLISVRDLSKSFEGSSGRPLTVLDDINLDVAEGEFVALLGRSGSGKSTLLRCIAGLMPPTHGQVLFRGERLTGPNRDTTMVFQTFALLPWLTVQQNVELGLEARGVAAAARSERALRAIDLVGLDGYEGAYPKELSGGMRQRVGFARALVVEPAALLMDEPFSALDVLTSENLRGELLELWEGQRFPTKTMVMVTHNIEDAVLLADRILVLGTNPGRIRADLRNPLARPRRRGTPDFEELVDQIYRMMTQRDQVPPAAPSGRPAGRAPGTVSDTPLPRATVDGLSGLAEIMLGRHGGAADLADLAESLGLEVDDLLPLVDALVLLGFAELREERLELSAAGRVFAGASIQQSKEIFARAGLDYAPLVRTIYRALRGSLDGNLPIGFFTDILRTSFSEEDAASQLELAMDWGRYAELYAYDAARGLVIREEQGIDATLAETPGPARHGTLAVRLGAAPGSGKTFTMLREGRELRSQGADVVIGAVATRGRPRTEEAIGGLEIVPPASGGTPDGGTADGGLMDTAAVLARRPDVALVDDLGANAAGIAALRAAGIDVISTADVADVQATADAAAAITGRGPAATVPDAVLAGADEVQFVDSSPEALQKRLSHGNIYPPQQAAAARSAEFQTARLAALRELGLRLVADTLPATGRPREPQDVLVAVTGPDRAAALVRRGVRLARRGGAQCSVLLLGPGPQRAAAAGQIGELAGDVPQAERAGDPAAVIPASVREAGASHLVLAAPPPALLDRLRGTAIERLLTQLPDVHLHVLPPAPAAPGEQDPGPAAVRPAGPAEGPGSSPASAGPASSPASPAGAARPASPADSAHPGHPGPTARRPPRAAVRVYLGYARGSGTTTAMLGEAVRRTSRGTDVVVAGVEPRGREGISALLDELTVIGDGASPDIAAIAARRPEVAFLDELTGLTPAGESRLAAARRLADAGIAVVATAHLSGRADDDLDEAALLALADEIELVDVAPSALIERVRRGEIVPPDQVEAALATDYAPAELAARRERAFRIVAEHGDRRLAAYRADDRRRADSDDARPPAVLACVAPRPGMEDLIRRAAALAAQVDGEFLAATVTDGPEPDPLVAGYAALAAQLGGELAVLSGSSPAAALAAYARERRVSEMVLARSSSGRPGRFPVLRGLAAAP